MSNTTDKANAALLRHEPLFKLCQIYGEAKWDAMNEGVK